MSEEDEEQTTFYTDQGTSKIPFRLKNVGATYQRLVNSAFRTQPGRNLEAYEDDMVIESKTEQEMIMDIAETFDNLRRVNMKLNLRKCSFGVEEGKFLEYMVTSEGIRANPKKMKVVADMQSSKTLKEMQSLSKKLAALNCFLSRSTERALPFFETPKNITKENKDDYQWMEEAEHALQEMKKLILELLTLNTPALKEVLYVYLATSQDALAKYAVELGAYNIMYVPQNAIKGQVLADFINEIPVGTEHIEIYSLANEEAKMEEWTLYTNGATSLKGVGAGLVLIEIQPGWNIRMLSGSTSQAPTMRQSMKNS
ncbi:hypothetical protein Tco_0134423 [Tanacetum coccineum]